MMPTTVPKNIDKYFFNRTNDIKKINLQINSIYEDLPNQILITGNRGVGKTFLLKKILQDSDEKTLTLFIDISKIYSTNKKVTEEEVLKEILLQIHIALQKKQSLFKKFEENIKMFGKNLTLHDYEFTDASSIFDIPIPKIKDNYKSLSKFVLQLPQQIVDSNEEINGFIIVFDEFQFLKHVENPEAFFWLFRSYIQDQSNICYIFTGSVSKTAEIIETINGQTGAFGGRMIQINIEAFSKEETKKYLEDKATDLNFTSDGFERFYTCTRGIPAYINTFCNVLDSGKIYNEEMIKENFLLKMDQIVIMWLYIWGNLNEYEKTIVKLLTDNDNLTWNKLLDKTKYSKSTLTKYIESLNNKAIIKYNHDKNYSLNDPMLKTWLKHKKETEGQYPL
ncbi:MAG: ATP-binding protein [Methanosphaera stadtmanae]|nr:ATP-binding protein [Methanosphaera stadtmanae]